MRNTLVAPNVRGIIRNAAYAIGVGEAELLSPTRTKKLSRARFAAMMKLRTLGMSYPRIGRALGRDSSTVIHGVREGRRLRCVDPDFAELLAAMEAMPEPVQECDRPKAAAAHFPYRHRTMAEVMAAEALALVGIGVRAL